MYWLTGGFLYRYLGMLMLAVGIVTCSKAAIVTVPAGLPAGTTYRLVFVTADTTNAESTNIADYNTYVTNEALATPALAALNATWTAIGSTDSIDAIANVGGFASTALIYRLDGSEVAPSTAALFNDDNIPLLSPISIDQNDALYYGRVWTGTQDNGTYALVGQYDLGNPTPCVGSSSPNPGPFCYTVDAASTLHPLYAISSILTVTTPEPGSMGLIVLGAGILLFPMKRIRAS